MDIYDEFLKILEVEFQKGSRIKAEMTKSIRLVAGAEKGKYTLLNNFHMHLPGCWLWLQIIATPDKKSFAFKSHRNVTYKEYCEDALSVISRLGITEDDLKRSIFPDMSSDENRIIYFRIYCGLRKIGYSRRGLTG